MIYDIYHDEYKEYGYWHCYIFIPRSKQNSLHELILESRSRIGFQDFIHFRSIGAKAKTNHAKVRLIKSWSTILHYALQQQKLDACIYLGHDYSKPNYRYFKSSSEIIGARLVVFREKLSHSDMFNSMDAQQKVETTFRMGLKGGTHFLFRNEFITIGNIFIDCSEEIYEEYYDDYNMLTRFQQESNDNVEFLEDSKIIPIPKTSYKHEDIISDFMQLADVAIGGIRTQKLCMRKFPARFEATKCFKEILKKKVEVKNRMIRSRFQNAFSLSDAWIENEEWFFENMHVDTYDCLQQTLF